MCQPDKRVKEGSASLDGGVEMDWRGWASNIVMKEGELR
jgi:hypothetical protein